MKKRDKPAARPQSQIRRAPVAQRAEPTLNDLPRWLPPVVFAFVTLVLFREFILGSGKLLGHDTLGAGYFARNFYTTFVHAFHQFPLWNPLMYGGLPFIDGMHGDIFYPPSLAMFFLNAESMWGWKIVLHVFLAGVFTYLWLRELEVSRGSALLGGLIFMMGADLVSLVYPGGDGKLFVSALAPLAFLLTERAVRLGRLRDYAAFSLGIALLVFTSHMQLAYFAIWGVSLYFFFRVVQKWRSGEWRGGRVGVNLAAFALAGVIAVGAAAIQFLPPLEYLRGWSQRASKTVTAQQATGYAYSTSWSMHPEEVMSLVVPEFAGDNVQTETRSGNSYWGRNDIKFNNEYAGFVPLLLLPLLLLKRRRGRSLFFVFLALFAVVFAVGAHTPLFRLFYLIPGVKLFRAPSLIIFLYGLSLATLGALAFDRAVEMGRDRDEAGTARKALWIGTGAMALLALMASTEVFMTAWRGVFYSAITTNKIAALATHLPAIKQGFWITFAVALGVSLAWEGYARRIWSARAALVAVGVIAFLEMYRVDRVFIVGTLALNEAYDPTEFEPDESISYLKEQQASGKVFRVFDLAALLRSQMPAGYPVNVFAIHGLEQMAGHHGNEIGRYRELLGGDQPVNAVLKSATVFDITNTEYLTSTALIELPGFTEVFRGSRSVVYRKGDVMPRAYLVGAVEVVPDAQAVDRLLAPDFDFRTTALLAETLPAGVTIAPNPQGSVEWIERANTKQRLRVSTDRPALLMVLDNYYHAWKADIGGKEVPVVRANHAFRAVPVPAGQHEVTLRYDTAYLRGPALASALILIVLLLIAFGSPLADRLRSRKAA